MIPGILPEGTTGRENKLFLAAAAPSGQMIRILVIDDHPLIRDGIATLIATQPDMQVVAEASDGRQGIDRFRSHRPDVTLLDLQMPGINGLDSLAAMRREVPDARIIILTTYTGDMQTKRALEAGARGYLLKNVLHEELLASIRAVHSGQRRISPEIAAEVADHSMDDVLTMGEIEVLRSISAGCANKEIAARLFLKEETVKSRVKSILTKLNANDRTHAAMIGLKRGIINL
jgi:DNA-binding NarL/FixJ family response regulator